MDCHKVYCGSNYEVYTVIAMSRKESKIYELARRCDCSTATISRVFNESDKVAGTTRDRVLAEAKRLGYKPHFSARKKTVALVLEGGGRHIGGFRAMMISALISRAAELGYAVIVFDIKDLSLLNENIMSGIIAFSFRTEQQSAFADSKLPLVVINNPLAGLHAVCVDQRSGIMHAVQHLVERGHREIGCIAVAPSGWVNEERVSGFIAALKQHALKYAPERIAFFAEKEIVETISGVLRDGVSAIIVCGEDEGIRAAHALSVLGKSVPQDISIISYENTSVSSFLSPPHTTISQNIEEVVHAAFDMLDKLLKNEEGGAARVDVASGLIERNSVRNLNYLNEQST